MTDFHGRLSELLKARFPILCVESYEEQRVIEAVRRIVQDAKLVRTPRAIVTWSLTEGLVHEDGSRRTSTNEPSRALDAVIGIKQPCVVILRDLHHAYDERTGSPGVIRRLRDIAQAFKNGPVPRTLLLLSPVLRIPAELEKDVTIVDFALPTEAEIRATLDAMIAANAGRIRVDLDEIGRERLAKAALGLTLQEAENAFARALVQDEVLDLSDIDLVHDEKRQAVRKSGLLEFVDLTTDLADVGGLENLKRWLHRRNHAFLAEAAEYGLPAPRGVLITGVPGCGKSLTAKAVATAWGLPLLRFDIGRVFSGLVGSSEQNMRTAIQTAEAVAPCVLWVDEIEKGFSAVGGGDSGTSSRVFGTFLTWMQEKRQSVFVVATANDFERLPPELLRKGRFDEIFFVDLPTRAERVPIWSVHLTRRLRNKRVVGALSPTPATLDELATLSDGYSGAEIEQAVVTGLYDAFAERRPLEYDDLVRALVNMVPLSVTQAERITGIRRWADQRAVAATAAEDWDPGGRRDFGEPPSRPSGGRPVEY
ncbi:AAA family ATPase [Polymorphospora rubra]|uniref:AAA family ATPase n=1 Tax=Polymorphospora rubra TaxID=338584 RepID=UPI0033EF568D